MPERRSGATSRSLRAQKHPVSPSRRPPPASRPERETCFYLQVRPRSAAATGTSPAWRSWRESCCLCDLVSKSGRRWGWGWGWGQKMHHFKGKPWHFCISYSYSCCRRLVSPTQLINSAYFARQQPIKSRYYAPVCNWRGRTTTFLRPHASGALPARVGAPAWLLITLKHARAEGAWYLRKPELCPTCRPSATLQRRFCGSLRLKNEIQSDGTVKSGPKDLKNIIGLTG